MITLESGGMSSSKKIAYSISKIPIPRNERKQTGPKCIPSIMLLGPHVGAQHPCMCLP
jgi:hypothetical protein